MPSFFARRKSSAASVSSASSADSLSDQIKAKRQQSKKNQKDFEAAHAHLSRFGSEGGAAVPPFSSCVSQPGLTLQPIAETDAQLVPHRLHVPTPPSYFEDSLVSPPAYANRKIIVRGQGQQQDPMLLHAKLVSSAAKGRACTSIGR